MGENDLKFMVINASDIADRVQVMTVTNLTCISYYPSRPYQKDTGSILLSSLHPPIHFFTLIHDSASSSILTQNPRHAWHMTCARGGVPRCGCLPTARRRTASRYRKRPRRKCSKENGTWSAHAPPHSPLWLRRWRQQWRALSNCGSTVCTSNISAPWE